MIGIFYSICCTYWPIIICNDVLFVLYETSVSFYGVENS